MDKAPEALFLTVAGVLLHVKGIVSDIFWMDIVGGALCVVGLILFWCASDKLLQFIKRQKRHERKVDKLEDMVSETDVIARGASRRAADAEEKAKKAQGQKVKGQITYLHKEKAAEA